LELVLVRALVRALGPVPVPALAQAPGLVLEPERARELV